MGRKEEVEKRTPLQGAANAYLIKAPQAENPNMQRTVVTNLVLSITIMLSPKY